MESKRQKFKRLSAGLVALVGGIGIAAIAPPQAQASIINGGISFDGSEVLYLNSTGTGTTATDFISAHSIVFSPSSIVAPLANKSFSIDTAGTPVAMYSPLAINPPQLPIPVTAPLWSVTSGGVTYSFDLATLTEPVDQPTFLVLTGAGTVSDGTPADNNTGTWVATFTTSGSTYGWNASFNAAAVPEPASIGLLALASVGLLARRKRA